MTEIQKKTEKTPTIANFLAQPSTSKFLEEQLGLKKKEFVQNLIAITDSDNLLKDCNPAELMKCALNATALDLPLNKNMGSAYVIAYKQKQGDVYVTKPQFQIGWKGFYQLAIRTEKYKKLAVTAVREGEIRVNKFTDDFEILGDFPENPIVGYLAFFELKSGFSKCLYMTIEELKVHAQKYSKSYSYASSVWKTNFEAMCEKTVLKLLLSKYGDFSPEVSMAIEKDQMSSDGIYIDNPSSSRSVINTNIIEQQDIVDVPAQEVVEAKEVSFDEF